MKSKHGESTATRRQCSQLKRQPRAARSLGPAARRQLLRERRLMAKVRYGRCTPSEYVEVLPKLLGTKGDEARAAVRQAVLFVGHTADQLLHTLVQDDADVLHAIAHAPDWNEAIITIRRGEEANAYHVERDKNGQSRIKALPRHTALGHSRK